MAIIKVGNTADEIGGTRYTGTAKARDASYAAEEAFFDTEMFTSGDTTVWKIGGETEAWVHFRIVIDDEGSRVDGHLFHVRDTDATIIFRLDALNDLYHAEAEVGDNRLTGADFSLPRGTVRTVDLHLWHDGSKARFDVWLDGTLTSEASYDSASAPLIDSIHLVNFELRDGVDNGIYISELVITDSEPTTGWRLATLAPDAAGHHTDLTGDISALDTMRDGTTLSGGAGGNRASWTLSAYGGPAAPSGIRAVVTAARVTKGITGPQQYEHSLRIGSTDYDSPGYSPSPGGEFHVWDDNPATGSAWATSDLTGLEQGVEIKT